MAQGPFAGIRVLDLGTNIAAPYAAMFLADQGADVVKVEDPGGDPYRAEPGFQTVNRNKRSLVGDPQPLLAVADVIFVDRPGQADRLRAANPGAVIITMPPWGERGQKVGDPYSRTIMHAATGIAWNQNSYGETPVDIVVPIVAYGTGVLGALAAATGLLVRRERRVAPTYEVSQLSGAGALQLGEYRLDGDDEPRATGSPLGSKGRVGCYRLIEAGDGLWFFLACGTERFYRRMLDVIGRPDLLGEPELANPPWGLMSDEAIARITPVLDQAFAAHPRDHWLRLLAEADVPAQPVLTREEFLQLPLVSANHMDLTVEHPELGPVSMMGVPVEVAEAPGAVTAAAPLLGQHTEEVLREWSAVEPLSAPSGDGGSAQLPLAGKRVIDLASFIAGPVVSRHLGMLGADVIKVEPPSGDPFRAIGPLFSSWNQAKRSVIIDLQTEAGQAELHRLVATADAVIENFRPGVSQRLGCDHATLSAIKPDLVFLSSPGYGRDEAMADRPAFDPLVQAIGGFMAAQGGIDDPSQGGEPVFLSVPIHDVMTPMIGAFGVICGWWQQGRPAGETVPAEETLPAGETKMADGGGGRAQHVRTSLVESTMVAQAAEFTRFAGRPAPTLGGFDYRGHDGNTWHHGPPETGPAEPIAKPTASPVPSPVSGPINGLMTEQLHWRDGPLTVPIESHGLTSSALAAANELSLVQPSDRFGPLLVFGQLVGGAGPHPGPAPGLGEHTEAVLAELNRPEE